MTDAVEQFLNKADVRATVPLVEFYERVVADFASRANQLRLAALAVTISNEIPGMFQLEKCNYEDESGIISYGRAIESFFFKKLAFFSQARLAWILRISDNFNL